MELVYLEGIQSPTAPTVSATLRATDILVAKSRVDRQCSSSELYVMPSRLTTDAPSACLQVASL